MQPPEAGASSSMPSLSRSEAGIGKVEALDQDADEGAVELAAAIHRSLAQVAELDAHDARVARRGDRGAALLPGEGQVGHLAEALARAEHRDQLLVLAYVHLALDHQAEEVAGLALAHQRGAGGHALPLRDGDHL